jgi:hypothetical protein
MGGRVRFRTTEPLAKREGLTIVAARPKGFVREPSTADNIGYFLGDNLTAVIALLGALLVVSYFLVAWHLVGRDPDLGTVIPLFKPPRGLSPAGARFVSRMGFDDKTFSAAVVNLAVKGAVTIDDSDGTFTLRRTAWGGGGLSRGERKLLKDLFDGVDKTGELALAPINNSAIRSANETLETVLTTEFGNTHFLDNSVYVVVGGMLSVLVIGAAIWIPGAIESFLPAIVVSVFGSVFGTMLVMRLRRWR